MEVALGYSFDEDGLIKLQKDLNHLLNNLNDQNIKSIRTEYCKVASKGGETIIDGSLLEMFDYDVASSKASTTLRLRAGYNKATSNFEFSLWNSVSTTPTIQLDSIGNAVFSGSINTSESMFIGNNIFLGQTNSTISKGLYFNATSPSTSESEGTTDMRSAIYTVSTGSGIVINFNTTNILDVSGLNEIYIGRNVDLTNSTVEAISITTGNYLTNYKPHVILGDESRHNVFLGNDYAGSSWQSTNALEGKGYIDVTTPFILSDYLKSCWNFQGKNFEEFGSTVGWIPNALCYVDATASSTNARSLNNNGLTLVNNTTSSGDIQIYKLYSDFNAYVSNSNQSMSSNAIFYVLMYVYDLTRINTLSTKAFQVELASSSGSGDKIRWLLGGTTTLSTLTTGWNLVRQRLGYNGYYTSTNADMSSIKYFRLSFEVNANSSGKIATFQSFGFLCPSSQSSTSPIMAPRYDDLHGGRRASILSANMDLTWIMRRNSSTGLSLFSGASLYNTLNLGTIFPTMGYSYGLEHLYSHTLNGNSKMQFTVVCKNDKGNLPEVGGFLDESYLESTASGKYYVYATSSAISLTCLYNSTAISDVTRSITVAYGDEFKITLWKEDPPIYNCLVSMSQITALIEKVGTTQSFTLAYTWDKCFWKKVRYVPYITTHEVNSGAEIKEVIISRR